jgi:hypothetical protein
VHQIAHQAVGAAAPSIDEPGILLGKRLLSTIMIATAETAYSDL